MLIQCNKSCIIPVIFKKTTLYTEFESKSEAVTVPLQVQAHQLVNIETEADVSDGTAGVGLTEERSEGCNFISS